MGALYTGLREPRPEETDGLSDPSRHSTLAQRGSVASFPRGIALSRERLCII